MARTSSPVNTSDVNTRTRDDLPTRSAGIVDTLYKRHVQYQKVKVPAQRSQLRGDAHHTIEQRDRAQHEVAQQAVTTHEIVNLAMMHGNRLHSQSQTATNMLKPRVIIANRRCQPESRLTVATHGHTDHSVIFKYTGPMWGSCLCFAA